MCIYTYTCMCIFIRVRIDVCMPVLYDITYLIYVCMFLKDSLTSNAINLYTDICACIYIYICTCRYRYMYV